MSERLFTARYENHDDFEAFEVGVTISEGQSLDPKVLAMLIAELINTVEHIQQSVVVYGENESTAGPTERDSQEGSPGDQDCGQRESES